MLFKRLCNRFKPDLKTRYDFLSVESVLCCFILEFSKLRCQLKMLLSHPHLHSVELVVELFLLFLLDLCWLVNYFVDFSHTPFNVENSFAQTFVILTELSKEIHQSV